MGRKNKPRLIPEQNKGICASICLCQLTMVLSCVSIVYLSVAVYAPSFKAFKSGFETEPVMCETNDIQMKAHCNWASCGEWCLTKTSGFCPQIMSSVRRNGTDIQLNNCRKINSTPCPQVDPEQMKDTNCNNGTVCSNLHGLFECSNGHCRNISEYFQCHYNPNGPHIDPEKDNTKLNGFFHCYGPKCITIKKHFNCDRYCSKITTTNANVLLMQDNNLVTAECDDGVAFNEARGNDEGVRIQPKKFWGDDEGILLTNCMTVTKDVDRIVATDCLNGTLLEPEVIPTPFMNFTQFWRIYKQSNKILDPEQRFLPKQSALTIYNSSKLFINLEGCVNTLAGECKAFVKRHGSDGDNNTAQSRYQCFYNKVDPAFVVTRFDLESTHRILLISLIVPIVLFIVSSISLCVITKTVKVGDDARMRCIWSGNESDDVEEHYGRNHNNKKVYDTEDEMSPYEDNFEHEEDTRNRFENNTIAAELETPFVPLSPCEENTEKSTMSNETGAKSDDSSKPLVII